MLISDTSNGEAAVSFNDNLKFASYREGSDSGSEKVWGVRRLGLRFCGHWALSQHP